MANEYDESKETSGHDYESETDKKIGMSTQKESEALADSGLKKLLNTTKLVFELVADYARGNYSQAPWRTIAAAILAIVYAINPFDIIPDFIPGVGWIDDIAILGLLLSGLSYDLKDYCRFKGVEPEECGLIEKKDYD